MENQNRIGQLCETGKIKLSSVTTDLLRRVRTAHVAGDCGGPARAWLDGGLRQEPARADAASDDHPWNRSEDGLDDSGGTGGGRAYLAMPSTWPVGRDYVPGIAKVAASG